MQTNRYRSSLLLTVALAAVCVAGPLVAGEAVEGCTPAEQAATARVENTILSDLASGKTYEQTEADVASIFAGQPGVDVVVILNDALQFLMDAGVIPQGSLGNAQAFLARGKATVAGRHPS